MPTLPVTPFELVIAFVLVTIGSALQGSIGFGLAVVSAPILVLLNPAFMPGPMLLAAMLLVILIAYRDRAAVVPSDIPLGIIGRVLGTIPAAYAISVLPVHVYDILFASMLVLAVLLSASGWHIPPTPRNIIAAATLSGFTATTSSLGGAPMALVYQSEEGPRIRGTLSTIFIAGTIISIAGLWCVGKFGVEEFVVGVLMMPGVLVGYQLSHVTSRWIDRFDIRPALLAFAGLSAVVILVRALW